MASSNNVTKNNTANKYGAVNRYATAASNSGWGPLAPSIAQTSALASTTLAEYLKESSAYSNPMAQQQQQQQQQPGPSATSLPWAAAVKAAEQHQFNQLQNAAVNRSTATAAAAAVAANAFESRTNTIGSWSSPETSSSVRSGWNTDGSMKGDGTPDDGTAIWGNPCTKKTGIDWTEKESLLHPPHANNENSEKRIHKVELAVSSINGTEAWGTPSFSGGGNTISAPNSQQQSKSNDNSGNTYGTKTTINNEPIGWNESSSLQGNNESSSPPSNSIWNQLANNVKQQSTTDWLSSYSSTASSSIVGDVSRSRMDELSKQLEATSLFNSISPTSSLAKSTSSTSTSAGNNPNYNNQSSAINNSTNNVISSGPIGGGSSGNNSVTDLKQLSANFFNDLLDSSSRSSGGTLASSNNSKSQMNAYPLGITPSRELLKQMVHQIQLAVQAGHINAQILNQPMSTPTLQLVYTLLQQIRLLQQFQEIQQRTVSKSNDINSTNLDLQINRVQQNILLLQKAITLQQAALTKNNTLVDQNSKQQQEANNFSYANISKLSTNMKVPSNNISNLISNNSIDSFKRSSLIDTLPSNSNSESQRSAQVAIDANAPIDKTVSPILQTSVNDIFNGRAQSFASQQQQAQKAGLLSAHPSSSSSSSSSNAAWSAFNSSDLVSTGWPRISTNLTQQDQQSNSDLMSEIFKARGWGGSSLANDGSANKEMNPSMSLAPGANMSMGRPNSASSNLKQMSETNDILNKDQSSFYDWGNNSDSLKRNFEADGAPASSSFSPSAIGGLSLQSNPWLFAPNSLSLNAASGMDNLIGGDGKSKMNNIGMDKAGGDALNFLRSASSANNMQQQQAQQQQHQQQRSSTSMYDWGGIGSSASQFDANSSPIGSKQISANSGSAQTTAAIGSSPQGGRPAPPPGILSGFGPMTSVSDVPNMESNNLRRSVAETQAPTRESAASLWSGAWFD